MKVDNAIILAAGISSRFVPLSFEKHKALTVVRGEVLIERQIEQLITAGVPEIYIVTGYKAKQFEYLVPKYNVTTINNPDYLTRNNNASIWVAREFLGNSYICSADNYFVENPFERHVDNSYYAAVFSEGHTNEWCMTENAEGFVDSVTIGGENAWYMLGHVFWSKEFTKNFLSILEEEYHLPETRGKLWESIFMSHLDKLPMRIRRYPNDLIYEFDSLEELRRFDTSYNYDARSSILKTIKEDLNVAYSDMTHFAPIEEPGREPVGFEFDVPSGHYQYQYGTQKLKRLY